MTFAIRPFHASDLPALYRICLLTGDNGTDASAVYHDPELLGHYYAAPYAVLEPDLCFILTKEHVPCGYVLGTRDSDTFARETEERWFPLLRQRYPLPDADDHSPDASLIRHIHAGCHAHPELASYPAHLHIDILPEGQGQGYGRALITTFVDRLCELGVPGVHLGVGINNTNAIAFYRRVGFQTIQEERWGLMLGMVLADRAPLPQ